MKFKSIRNVLLIGAATTALVACDANMADVVDPAPTPTASPTPAPTPTPTPTPTSSTADISLVPASFDDSRSELAITTVSVDGNAGPVTVEVVEITGPILTDLTLEAGVGYRMNGTVLVGSDTGTGGVAATLTIEPGATIYGQGDTDGLVITRGSTINAAGTAAAPIVFTSLNEVLRSQGSLTATGEERGEWGGLIINGFAPINDCDDGSATPGSADCVKDGEANSGFFGGDAPADNSGTVSYVRVEFGGVVFNGDNEANGIAFQGVGNGTTVDHIHIHNNLDDALEFFGGTVDVNYVVATGTSDDAIDWTDGWTGSVQFAAVKAGTGLRDDAYGIEGDNNSGNNDLAPRSNPTISNFTFVGNTEMVTGIRVRRGSGATLANGVVADFPRALDIDDQATFDGFSTSPARLIIASQFWNNTVEVRDDDDAFDPDASLTTAALTDVALGSPLATDSFVPGVAATAAVPVFTNLDAGQFIETPTYIGAFAPTDTTTNNWAAGWIKDGTLFPAAGPASCPTGTTQAGAIGEKVVCNVAGNITSDLTLSNGSDLLYRLDGTVFVGTDGGATATNVGGSIQATLTIEPGVTVFGDGASDGLVVTRGSKIIAEGTASQPIVFTAGSVLRGEVATADLATLRGEWGGLVLNGKAPINDCDSATATPGTADCVKDGEANSGFFGGDVPDDNSGSIEYFRLEYGGVVFNGDNEANGIAAQGVGSGTNLDFIQIHNNLDDGVEFFGGTANLKHLVVTGQSDDAIDWTDGWTGNVQYAIIEGVSGLNLRDDVYGMEGDNNSGDNDLLPRSNPSIANFTILGNSDWVAGMRMRRGTAGDFVNGIVVGATRGLDLDDQATFDGFSGDDTTGNEILQYRGMFMDNPVEVRDDDDTFDPDASLTLAEIVGDTTGVSTMSGFSFYGDTTRGVVPGASEAGVTPFDATTLDATFFDTTNFVGAVSGSNDTWYLGWTIDSTGALTTAP